jgi:hypothetical protein
MTNKETVERKIGLTFDYVNFLIDNPEMAENLPEKFNLEIIEKDFPRKEKTKIKKGHKETQKTVRVQNSFEVIQ